VSCTAAEETRLGVCAPRSLYRFLGNHRCQVPTHRLWSTANGPGSSEFHLRSRFWFITNDHQQLFRRTSRSPLASQTRRGMITKLTTSSLKVALNKLRQCGSPHGQPVALAIAARRRPTKVKANYSRLAGDQKTTDQGYRAEAGVSQNRQMDQSPPAPEEEGTGRCCFL